MENLIEKEIISHEAALAMMLDVARRRGDQLQIKTLLFHLKNFDH